MDIFRPNDSFVWQCRLSFVQNADSTRFVIVGLVGSFIAVASVVSNVLLLHVFSTSRRLRRQNYANPVMLALFDILVSTCYILLISVRMIAFHYEIPQLIDNWIFYVQYIYVFKHICETVCNFLLVVASFERLFANSPIGRQKNVLVFMVRQKKLVFAVIVVVSVLLKGTLMFETKIEFLPHCPEMERYVPVQSNHVDLLAPIRFWVRKTLTVVAPFLVLSYCNCRIVAELRSKHKEATQKSLKKRSKRGSLTSSSIRRHYNDKKGVRVATRTLVLVVGCYLLSNSLSTVVNFWEFTNPDCVERHYYSFLVLSDVAWLLTIVGCALRLPIYCISDARIRKAIGRAIFRCSYRALPLEVQQNHMDKWSFVVVSNSLRSNLTNMNNTVFASQDWLGGRNKRTKDELAFLLQTRRKMLVDMTFKMAMSVQPDQETKDDWLTDIQEEESLYEGKLSRFRTIQAVL